MDLLCKFHLFEIDDLNYEVALVNKFLNSIEVKVKFVTKTKHTVPLDSAYKCSHTGHQRSVSWKSPKITISRNDFSGSPGKRTTQENFQWENIFRFLFLRLRSPLPMALAGPSSTAMD